jgi:hypothetical protein
MYEKYKKFIGEHSYSPLWRLSLNPTLDQYSVGGITGLTHHGIHSKGKGTVWRIPGSVFQKSSPSGVLSPSHPPIMKIMKVCMECCLSRKLMRVFVEGWSQRHKNSNLPERRQMFNISHTVCTRSSDTTSHSYQALGGALPKSKFADTGQGPTLKVSLYGTRASLIYSATYFLFLCSFRTPSLSISDILHPQIAIRLNVHFYLFAFFTGLLCVHIHIYSYTVYFWFCNILNFM